MSGPQEHPHGLLLFDRLGRALGNTGAALGAGVLVDDGLDVLHADGLDRTDGNTALTTDTVICFDSDHVFSSLQDEIGRAHV